MMSRENERYRALRAIAGADFHTCFYCGCLATEFDYAPPLEHWQAFALRGASADNLQVPCCKECHGLLKPCAMGLIQQRREWVQTKLAAKYAKAIRVYLKWTPEELAELDYNLGHSIAAGLALGEEAYQRSQYVGFAYEIDGATMDESVLKSAPVVVFEQRFSDLKSALIAMSQQYGVKTAQLVDALAQHDNNLEAVIRAHQRAQHDAQERRRLQRLCRAFAQRHQQSIRYVTNEIERLLDKHELLSFEEALERLYQERILPRQQRHRQEP
ncbi:MAG: hypothetical protein R3Y10_00105 [Ferrimonas sp.]